MDNKIIERVRKLLALSKCGGATEAEAQLAASRAAEIMEQHGLEMAAIEMAGGEGEGRKKDEASTQGLAREKWAETLMEAVAESCFVDAQTIYNYGLRTGTKLVGFSLIGRHSAVVSCQLMYDYLSRTVIRLCRREVESQRFFRFGCAERISERLRYRHNEQLRKQREEADRQRSAAPSGSGRAVVIVLADYQQSERDLNEDFRRGKPPGTAAAERAQRQAEYDARERAMADIMADGVSWDVAWWMTNYNMTLEEATARQAASESGNAQTSRSHKYKERVDFDARRRRSPSYSRGRVAGDNVGLEVQIGNSATPKIGG